MERRWLVLAQSYDLTQRLGDFSDEAKRQADKLQAQRSARITPFLRDQAFDPETVEAMGKAFDTTCMALGLSNRDDAMTKLLPKRSSNWHNADTKIRRRCIWPRSRNLSPIRNSPMRTSPLSVGNATNQQGCIA